jgi:hypothetical protein
MRRRACESGQASVEYLAAVALVAAVLGATTVFVGGAPVFAATVLDGFRRALCVVVGGGCAAEATPCVVATRTTDERAGIDIALIRIDRHSGILRQERSDGTIAITEIEDLDGGVAVGIGAHGHVHVGRLNIALGGELQAGMLAQVGHGRTFVVHSRAEADRLVDRLVHGSPHTLLVDLPVRVVRGALGMGEKGVPRADQVYYEAGAKGLVAAGLSGMVASTELLAAIAQTVGIRVDRQTGQRTLYLHLSGHAAAPLATVLGEVGVTGDGDFVAGLTLDRAGHALEFSVSGAGRLAAGRTSPISTLVPSIGPLAQSGDRYELDARLDLLNGENAALVRRFLLALPMAGGPQELLDAGGALAERLRTDARLDARVYEVNSMETAVDGGLAVGVKLGGLFSFERSAGRLLQAAGRPPEGWWEPRHDCAA